MSWQKELENGVRSMEQLAPKLGLSPEEAQRREEIAKRFPMMITPYYLSLVDTSDPDDPIGRMCIPSLDELDPGGSFDTSGEASNTPSSRACSTNTRLRCCCSRQIGARCTAATVSASAWSA